MKILIAGEGGQGVQLAAEVLAFAAFLKGKQSSVIPNFGVEQRGGVSLAFVILDEDVSYPKFDKAEILAVLCDRAIERISHYIDDGTKTIYGPAVTQQTRKQARTISDEGLPPKVWNILVLSKIIELAGLLTKNDIKEALEYKLNEKFKKNPKLLDLNLKALGMEV